MSETPAPEPCARVYFCRNLFRRAQQQTRLLGSPGRDEKELSCESPTKAGRRPTHLESQSQQEDAKPLTHAGSQRLHSPLKPWMEPPICNSKQSIHPKQKDSHPQQVGDDDIHAH